MKFIAFWLSRGKGNDAKEGNSNLDLYIDIWSIKYY